VHGLCRSLVRLGHECHVYTTNADGKKDLNVAIKKPVLMDGVRITYFRSSFLRKIFYAPNMRKTLKSTMENYNLIHLHSPYVWPTWMAARMAFKAKKPYVMTTRGMLVRDLVHKKSRWAKSVWISLIERRNLERAALVHFTTQSEEAQVRQFGFSLKKTVVLGHGIDEAPTQGLTPESPRENIISFLNGAPFLLYVGRISWEKGLNRLIEAMAYVKDIPLLFVGNGDAEYLKTLKDIAQKNGVSNQLIFAGPYYGSVKYDLYRKAKMFVLPSFYENFGNVVLEAMMQGCPVVVTPGVGLADFVRQNGAGLVAEDSAQGLAKAINQLLGNPDLCKEIKTMGPKAVREKFTWDKIAECMADCYEQIIDGASNGKDRF